MPTTRPRFQVTETPEVEHALKLAERAWPELPRAERAARLLRAGADAIGDDLERDRLDRLGAIDFAAGSLGDAYEPGYLTTLRDDWPE